MRSGVDAVGGVPYNDRDSREHLEFVFRLAEEWGKPIDLHLDFSDDPGTMAIADVVELTKSFGMQNRVAVGHLTALGSAEPETAQRLANDMAEAGISVFALPATDLYLNGRGDAARPRRGLAPVRTLLDAGVNVCFGTNNMRNAFTPFGTGDPLDIGLLLAQTAYMGSREDAAVVGMCTERAAEALRMTDYGIKSRIGCRACAYRRRGLRRANALLYDRPRERKVWRNGIKL
ncbi:amidohydrolase family protein [Cohnella faecalis]|uniref:Amidohydrolase 3 domain-containing protein n=1 Tax=Cohnella faecalis TaxID=2315694 RepID=A0A398CPW1_9BACL|nr:amidohydrolase family protein [Cohnella faecalis]RIE04472.1 hypothetical protein D3H35_07780 [Cohnella faecalis]